MFWCLVNVIFSLHVAVYQYLRKQHVIKVFFFWGGGGYSGGQKPLKKS